MRLDRFVSKWLARWLDRRASPPPNADDTPMAPMAPMLDCEAVMRQLWDYLDGALTPERMEAIRAHLASCARCQPQAAFERAFLRAVAASARAHSNPDLVRARVVETLRAAGFAVGR